MSVVLPTFNRASSLPRAISSVLAQTYADLELIVVDDGSTDETAAVAARIDDRRFSYLRLTERGGAAKARNAGIRAAAGELIAFQDSDDEWLPRKLELQVALMLSSGPDVGWVGGSHLVAGEGTQREVRPERVIRGVDHTLDLLHGEAFVTPTWLVRREALYEAGLFGEDMPNLEDWDLIFRLDDVCRFRAVEEPILVRHGSADSLFAHVPSRIAGLEAIVARHDHRWSAEPGEQARLYRVLGRLHSDVGCRGRAVRWLWRSVRRDPTRVRSYVLLARTALRRNPADKSGRISR